MVKIYELKEWLESGGKVRKVGEEITAHLNTAGALVTDYDRPYGISSLFKAEFEKVEEDVKKPWRPANDAYYCYITEGGYTTADVNQGKNADVQHLQFYNTFKTLEDAEVARDRWKAEKELLAMCDGNGGEYWGIAFDKDKHPVLDHVCSVNMADQRYYTPYRFTTQESCEKAIETLGVDKLKLIYNIKG